MDLFVTLWMLEQSKVFLIYIFLCEGAIVYLNTCTILRKLVYRGYFPDISKIINSKHSLKTILLILLSASTFVFAPFIFAIIAETIYFKVVKKINNDIDSLKEYLISLTEDEKDAFFGAKNSKSRDEVFKKICRKYLKSNRKRKKTEKKVVKKMTFENRLIPLAYTLDEVEYISNSLNMPFTLANDGNVNVAFIGIKIEDNITGTLNGEETPFSIISTKDASDKTFLVFTDFDDELTSIIDNIRIMRKNKSICSMNSSMQEISYEEVKKLERKM